MARARPYGFEGGACLRRKSASPTLSSVRFPGALRWSCSSCRGLLDHPGPPMSELTTPESQVRQEGGNRRGAPSLASLCDGSFGNRNAKEKKFSSQPPLRVLPSPIDEDHANPRAARRCRTEDPSTSSSLDEESRESSWREGRPGKAMEACPEASLIGQNAAGIALWYECKRADSRFF